jgi:hypothetical protein
MGDRTVHQVSCVTDIININTPKIMKNVRMSNIG